MTFASPTLERIVRFATASGRVARAFLGASPASTRGIAERLARFYQFLDASWTPATGRPWWVPAGIFLFRASYLSSAREEDLVEVAIVSGLPGRHNQGDTIEEALSNFEEANRTLPRRPSS